ncbi:MAG: hypothetical protein WEB57_03215 [Pseudohongiellaceae bacterium]
MTEQPAEYHVTGQTDEQRIDEKANRIYLQIIDVIEQQAGAVSMPELERICSYLAANCIAHVNGDTEKATLSLRRIMMDALGIANMPREAIEAPAKSE